MKTIREIVDRLERTADKQALEQNLYGKLWEAMLAITTPTHKEIDGQFHAAICPPESVASRAEDLVVAWWNKKEGIVDDAD